jgi:hypothetical protein
MGRHKVLKLGEKVEISAVHGHWLIVKVPPPAVEADPAQDAFVQHLLYSVTGPDVTVSRRCDAVTGPEVTALHQPQIVSEAKRFTASAWSFGSVEAAPS